MPRIAAVGCEQPRFQRLSSSQETRRSIEHWLPAGFAVSIRCRQRPVRVEPENLRHGVAAHEMSVTMEQYPIEA